MEHAIGYRILNALIEHAVENPEKKDQEAFLRNKTLARLACLTMRGYQRFLTLAGHQVVVENHGDSLAIRIDWDRVEGLLNVVDADFLLADDVDKLIMFGASRAVIGEITGAHPVYIANRRRALGIPPPDNKRPSTLDEFELDLVIDAWEGVHALSLVDRLIVVSKLLGKRIHQLWPAVKTYERDRARNEARRA